VLAAHRPQGRSLWRKRQRGTALYDAVYLASHDELSHEVDASHDPPHRWRRRGQQAQNQRRHRSRSESRRHLLCPAHRRPRILRWLRRHRLQRSFRNEKTYPGNRRRVIDVGNKIEKLRDAFDQISRELRSQYNIGTHRPTPTATALSAKWTSSPNRATTNPSPQRLLRHPRRED